MMLLLALLGCTPLPPDGQPGLTNRVREKIYERATVEFAEALLIKPAEALPTNAVMILFAPLIIREITGAAPTPERAGPGVESSDGTKRRIYFRQDQTVIGSHPHDQLTYCWHAAAAGQRRAGDAAPPDQCVRITLDSGGQPVVWETQADSSGAKVFFVSQSLETAAAAEFGRPLPGRRFFVERSLGDAPNTVVARVIEDGPAPMGPMVYLRADMWDVSTITCRCMPIQVRRLIGDQRYELAVLKEGDPGWAPATGCHQAATVRLEEHLRLPASF